MPRTIRPRFTVIGTAPHLQAGDSAVRPVSVLFDDPDCTGGVAELRLTAAEARDLAALLVQHAAETETEDPVTLARRHRTLLQIAADTSADLRPCDVYRVIEAAADADMPGFAAWLLAERPDIADAIAEAQADIAPACQGRN